MIIAFTGHRPHKLGFEWDYKGPVTAYLKGEIETVLSRFKPEFVITGLAMGTDTIAAVVAIKMGIKLICAVPCLHQDIKWSNEAKKAYKAILKRAYKVHYVSNMPYFSGCMDRRNEWMIDQLTEPEDLLVAVFDGSNGGTKNCIGYAISQHKHIEYIKPRP